MQKRAPRIGITAGDPAGIGPEVALKAIARIKKKSATPILICRRAIVEEFYPGLFSGFEILNPHYSPGDLQDGMRYLCDIDDNSPIPELGKGSLHTGRESLHYLDCAIELWKRGAIEALVTGPVSKGFISKSGTPFIGHTEHIAAAIGRGKPYMMMYSERYRVLLATTHLPLEKVPATVSADLLRMVIRAGYESISSIDGGRVTMAICGLDPHCGDDGAVGDFDRLVTGRAVEQARQEGYPVDGPFAADTLFVPERWGSYNLVIAHYHDQGLIPFKVLAFDTGVNVTVGLPLVRTSVDHGTAYDIAGRGIAKHQSMTEAIGLAVKLAHKRTTSP